MRILSLFLMAAVGGAAMTAAPAEASGVMTCKAGPKSKWKSQESLRDKLIAEKWQITKIEIDGGCYEVYGTTPEGDRVEAYFHPLTLEKLYVARRNKVLFRKPGY